MRIVKDFPKDGINFYDIAPLMANIEAWTNIINALCGQAEKYKPDIILGLESRGFLVGVPMALHMNLPFGMIRKKGKLPGETISESYALEYGEAEIEIQKHALKNVARVLLVDDLLATGGTLSAAENLVTKAGGVAVGSLCIIELEGLGGRDALKHPFESLISLPA